MIKKLGEIAEIRSGYTFRDGLNSFSAGNVLVFQAKDTSGINDLEVLPSIEFDAEKHYLREGDLLLSVRGSFRAGIVRAHGRPAIAASSVVIISLSEQALLPEYLALYLNSPHGQEQLRGVATGAAIKTLTKAELQHIPIPIPPPITQRALVHLEQNAQAQRQLLDRKKQLLNELLNATNTRATKETSR